MKMPMNKQIGGDEGADGAAVDVGEHIGAEHAAQDPGDAERGEQLGVDVAVIEVGDARGGRGGHLGRVHRGAGLGGWKAERQERRGRDQAEGHAQGPVHELRREANRRD
jgi:hypothetical protein